MQWKTILPHHDRQQATLHACGLPHTLSRVRRGTKPHTKLVEFIASVPLPRTPSDHQDAASATAASLHVGVASHCASKFTNRRPEHTFLHHRRFSPLRADCREICLASQARRTKLDSMQHSMHTALPSHRPGFNRASSFIPSSLSFFAGASTTDPLGPPRPRPPPRPA